MYDLFLLNVQGTGSTTGPTFNTETPTPSFTANYFIQWRANGLFTALQQFTTCELTQE